MSQRFKIGDVVKYIGHAKMPAPYNVILGSQLVIVDISRYDVCYCRSLGGGIVLLYDDELEPT